jgi:hypothetical protein
LCGLFLRLVYMANKLYITGGFKAKLYPTYRSFGAVTEELVERFGDVRGLEIRQILDEDEELPEGMREPAIALVTDKEVASRSWPADNELGKVLDAIEGDCPRVAEATSVTFEDIDYTYTRSGEGFMLLVPEYVDHRILGATRGAILTSAERATGSPPHTWHPGSLDMTIAHAENNVSERTLGHLADHLTSLLPLRVEFYPVEFTPDPRFDD